MPKEKPVETETELALSKLESQAPALAPPPPIDFGQIVKAALEHDITPERVDVIERLGKLALQQQERFEARMFSDAFARMQADIKTVKAVHPVTSAKGEVKYRVVMFHELMGAIEPILRKHQFSIKWTQAQDNGLMTVTGTLEYRGHKEPTSFTAKIGSGPPNCTTYQADGACETYCKGRALRAMLNIVIEQEDSDDPRGLGEPITKEQADDIRKRVQASGADETKFLAWAQAESYEKIMSGRYADIDDNLRRKERTTKR